MSILGSVLSIGGSLLGGLFGKSSAQKAQDKQNQYNDPVQIRARAEAAGFNPLLFVGPGVGNQAAPAASGHMGAAIADSSMMLANAVSGQAEEKARLQNLQLQNEKLQKEINQMTLRPKTAGIYGSGGIGVVTNEPKPIKAFNAGDDEFIGPLPMVPVWDANASKWDAIHPGVAKKLKIDPGSTMIAEDQTALHGEILGEAVVGVKNLDQMWDKIKLSVGKPWMHPALPAHNRGAGNTTKRQPLKLTFTGP